MHLLKEDRCEGVVIKETGTDRIHVKTTDTFKIPCIGASGLEDSFLH